MNFDNDDLKDYNNECDKLNEPYNTPGVKKICKQVLKFLKTKAFRLDHEDSVRDDCVLLNYWIYEKLYNGMNLFKMNQMNLIIKNVNLLLLSLLKITGKKERNCMNTVLITKQYVDKLITTINARNIILTLRKKLNYIKNSKRFVLLRKRINHKIMIKERKRIKKKHWKIRKNTMKKRKKKRTTHNQKNYHNNKKKPLKKIIHMMLPSQQVKCLLNLLPLYGVEFPTLQ
ncbi:variable surface protein Vir4 [Plasmodium vivax India VII]|uniref:Variable surface protein Vir4 n=1 Tax=Plasmodium vivax India VII TaxID=1077284 RepID=A0A0J9V8X6_PLAVI|nr:variable surface protein Vir4 [Plasmodium vivax India VII]